MRPDGWLFLIISWGLIVGLTVFCFIGSSEFIVGNLTLF